MVNRPTPPRFRRTRAFFGRYFATIRDPEAPAARRIGYVLAGLAVLLLAPLLALAVYALALLPFTPDTEDLARKTDARPSVVLDVRGEKVAEYERLNREWAELDAVSPHFLQALLATEDRRFYEHWGVDVRRLFGAAFKTLGGDTQGGSTLTQQLARNLYPEEIGRSVSVHRKLKEFITAMKLEWAHEKDELLEAYVNTVPFLYNAVGVQLAAETYFGKDARALTPTEAATLVGMLKGTSYYNPVRNPARALERRNLVLGEMAEIGAVPAGALDSLRARPLGLDFERQDGVRSEAPHFTAWLREWLEEWAQRNHYDLDTDGLVIHSTLDLRLQRAAQASVSENGEGLQAVADVEWGRSGLSGLGDGYGGYRAARGGVTPFAHFWERHPRTVNRFIGQTERFRRLTSAGMAEDAARDSLRRDPAFMDSLRTAKTRLEIGLLAVDPRDGAVRAWVGSRDWAKAPYDHVATAARQPGSTFKPFVYAAALQRGFLPGDVFRDEPVTIDLGHGRTWRPTNFEGTSGAEMTLTEGLVYSKNTITAQVMKEVGPGAVARLAHDMGVESDLHAVPALALGTSDVTLVDMVRAYATIASGGQRRDLLPVTRIERRDGRVVAEFAAEGRQGLDGHTAQVLRHMMRGVVDRGTGRRIRAQYGITADVAGKTGTTQNGADGWFILMHPHLVVGTWVGWGEPSIRWRSTHWGQGSRNALRVVGDFFREAQPVLGDARFSTPERYKEPGSIFARARSWVDDVWQPDSLDAGMAYDEMAFSDEDFYGNFSSDTLRTVRFEDEFGDDAFSEFEDTDGSEEDGDEDPAEVPDEYREERTAVERLYERAGEAPPAETQQEAPRQDAQPRPRDTPPAAPREDRPAPPSRGNAAGPPGQGTETQEGAGQRGGGPAAAEPTPPPAGADEEAPTDSGAAGA